MTEQRVKAGQITPLQGILLILAILAALLIASGAGAMLSGVIPGVWMQVAIWLVTGLFAFYLMRERIMEYNYTVSSGILYVERLYGIRSKVLLSLPINDIVALGDEKALRAAHPQLGRALNATLKGCPLPRKAVTYKKKGAYEMVILQPDEHMTKLLWDEAARAATARDRWG